MKTATTQTVKQLAQANGRQPVISLGYSAACKFVITKSVLVYSAGTFHLENGGIKIAVTEAEIDGLFLDTPENRKAIKAQFANL